MIGSMAPDFAYFVPHVYRWDTHDFDGLFLFCWPVGLLVWLFYVKVLERPTIELLPSPWRERVPRSMPVTPRALLLASVGVVIGAITHIAWDAFTHGDTPLVQLLPVLGAKVLEFRGRNIHVFGLLQYLSSVVGMLALVYWAWDLRNSPPQARGPRYRLGFLTNRARLLAALMIVGTSALAGLIGYTTTGERFENRVFVMLIDGMVAWAVAWCLVALLIHRVAQRLPAANPKR